MTRSRPSPRAGVAMPAALAWALAFGCMAPVLAPVHPMTASAGEISSFEMAGAFGYAAAPGAGLGDAVVPGSPFAEGELRFGLTPRVQLLAGLGVTFHRYFLPWPSSFSLGTKLALVDGDALSLALAPRLVGAGNPLLLGNSVFGTREGGLELPLLLTHHFANRMALSLQLWGRGYQLRQEDLALSTGPGDSAPPSVETGRAWGTGAAVLFTFPRLRGDRAEYSLWLGGEELWLTELSSTRSEGQAQGLNPLVSISRFSLTAGLGLAVP